MAGNFPPLAGKSKKFHASQKKFFEKKFHLQCIKWVKIGFLATFPQCIKQKIG